jgi:uncharacterized repeat protein (TIGR03809 family)
MTDATAILRDYHASRWRKLAEQRLEHVTELFVTGRWQRYFGERDFLDIVRQSKDAVAAWRRIECSHEAKVDARLPGTSYAAPESVIDAVSADVDELPEVAPAAPRWVAAADLDGAPAKLPSAPDVDEPELVSAAAIAELRPALLLRSPFEDAGGAIASQRLRRAQ